MPAIFSPPAVPLALGFGLGKEIVSRRLLLAGVAASILPDLDVIAFVFGIPYGASVRPSRVQPLIFFRLLCSFTRRVRASLVRF
jgi:inner membrane protein